MALVDPNVVIANLVKNKKGFTGLVNTKNAKPLSGIFSSSVKPIESGQTTKAIIQASQIRQATPTLEQLYPTIKTNFETINASFKNLGAFLTTATLPAQNATPTSQTPSGERQGAANPSNTQPPKGSSSIGSDLSAGFNSIKNYIGPAGFVIGLIALGLIALTPRGR